MKRLIIEQTGRAFIRTYKDTDVDLNDAVIGSLTNGVVITLDHIMMLDSHDEIMTVSARMSSDDTSVWVVSLQSIRFTTGITSRDGIIALNFESPNKMEVLWKPPADMALSLLVTVYRDGPLWWCDKCYLVAYDRAGVAYRLPVANVFDDTSLCTGDYSRSAGAISNLITGSYIQFRESPWNADLYSSKSDEFKLRTNKMFRWRASDDGFEQIESDGDWKSLCVRVGNDTVDKVAQLAVANSNRGGSHVEEDEDNPLDELDADEDGGDR